MPAQNIRSVLGAALFHEDDIHKYVATLSGGEKARLTLSLILSGPANIQQQTVDISVSAGFGLCNGTQKTPEALLEAADAAMYRCKRSKRAGTANQAAH